MSYNIIAVPAFRKGVKRLVKKYPNLKTDLEILFESLEQNPTQGKSLGRNCYKGIHPSKGIYKRRKKRQTFAEK